MIYEKLELQTQKAGVEGTIRPLETGRYSPGNPIPPRETRAARACDLAGRLTLEQLRQ